ncbi:Phage capsid scaffolding protein (GPO) serine peptidase [compost metagenome]
MKSLLSGKQAVADEQFAQVAEAVEAVADHVKDLPEKFGELESKHREQGTQLTQLSADLAELKKNLSRTQDPKQPQRPVVTGGKQAELTDC